MQYTSLPDGFTIQELDASHLEQFNALLRYAFQVTEEELVQGAGRRMKSSSQNSPFWNQPMYWAASRAKRWPRRSPYIPCR